jgi:NAD(P)-dependent dehydrogenase (short-subunit alcohol dehydrogenase family)
MPKSVLITGASSGIGACAARHLQERGFRVFGTRRKTRDDLPEGVHWIEMDVCDEASVGRGVAEVISAVTRLDALVCSAGLGIFGSVEEVSIEAAQQQLDANYFGVLRTLRAVLPHMREVGGGRVVLVGSLAGRAPIPFQSHYSASKAALDATALALRTEVRPFGIDVSLIEPGDINTPFNDAMHWTDVSGSAYGARVRSCEAVIRDSLPKAPGPEVIARVIAKALTARRPRVRYAAGPDSALVPLLRRLLPDWISLELIRSHFKV